MEKNSELELVYDVFDKSIMKLYDIHKGSFIELLCETSTNICQGDIITDCSEEEMEELTNIYSELTNLELNVDTVRKAFMFMVIRGLKEEKIPNSYHTPDTIAFIASFIAEKLIDGSKKVSVLDPLCGTGNLLFSFINNISEKQLEIYGCDNQEKLVSIFSSISNLLEYNSEVLLQDTLTTYFSGIDIIITDIDGYNNEVGYFPYQLILHHIHALNDKGYMIAIIPNDFFEFDNNHCFKKELLEYASIIGVISLPDKLFIEDKKAILVLTKETNDKNCLVLDIPSIEKEVDFVKKIQHIESWIKKRKEED